MDIVVIDVPDVRGMLLSRKFAADLGGSIQMDLSYAIIPTEASGIARLYRQVERRYHVEIPKKLENGEEFVPQGNPPHFELEFVQTLYHFFSFHCPSPPLSIKRSRFLFDRDMKYSDEQLH